MSENFVIKKDIAIEFPVQIDHICCEGCGTQLDFKVAMDGFGDLQITVSMHTCE